MQDYLLYYLQNKCDYCRDLAVKRQTKSEINKIIKQHEVDLESPERKHQMEIQKKNLEQSHQLELKEKEIETQLGFSLLSDAIKLPEVRQQIS